MQNGVATVNLTVTSLLGESFKLMCIADTPSAGELRLDLPVVDNKSVWHVLLQTSAKVGSLRASTIANNMGPPRQY